jgi:hypothetical protein
MSKTITLELLFRDLVGKASTFSHSLWDITLKRINVDILEMEDVLFHHDSAVMMPENPKGKSSKDGTPGSGAADDQLAVAGIRALALVFKEIEFDPDKRLIVTGHTDTSGGFQLNFELSDLRAKNVLYLLTGDRTEWAGVCYSRQKIEDYQQILTYVFKTRKWPCDPAGIDDTWGDNTEKATKNFIGSYNGKFVPDHAVLPLDPDLLRQVKSDNKKRWPIELWEAVYEIYNEDLYKTLDEDAAGLDALRKDVLYVDDSKPFLGCGESFPIDQARKNDYRSQTNRRVEILFFDKDEVPVMGCPKETDRKHLEKECPLWHKYHFLPTYIDPKDLYSVVYYMSFLYFNAQTNREMSVPDGLRIQAFENGTDPLNTATRWDNGVYAVKVQFKTPLSDGTHKSLHFEFTGVGEWVFTDKGGAVPAIVAMTPAGVNAMSLEDQRQYYDLPARWSSRNYWTRYDPNGAKSERFENVVKVEKKLRPIGPNKPLKGEPLLFSLDDIVLLDQDGGTQDIEDSDHSTPARNKVLSQDSRVKILRIDDATGYLTLYRSNPAVMSSARVPFPRNLISVRPCEVGQAKIVFFRDGFYTVARRRTQALAGWEANGFVVGSRVALRNDPHCHISWPMHLDDDEFSATGDYDLHYFHNLYFHGAHPVSYLVLYVSISFMADSRDPAKFGPIPGDPDVKKYVDEGIYNAMNHWNRKRYFWEESPTTANSVIIRPFYFFDERETFLVKPPPGGFNIYFNRRAGDITPPVPVPNTNHTQLFARGEILAAQQNALGGKSKFLAMVCRDENPKKHYGPAFQWSIRGETAATTYSLFKLNISGGDDWPGIFKNVPVTDHGENYGANTFAHELGHSIGQPDEYIKTDYQPDPAHAYKAPTFAQYFVAYSMESNETSMMYHNAAPRLHHLWYHIHKLTSEMVTPPLSTMLGAKKFVSRLSRGAGWELTYTRKLVSAGYPPLPAKLTDPLVSEKAYKVNNDPLRRLSLELFHLGRDETSTLYVHLKQPPIEYQGVIVVRQLMVLDFSKIPAMTNAQKRVRVSDIEKVWIGLGGHYRLVRGAKEIVNIYVHILPGFSVPTDPGHAARHYVLQFAPTNHPGGGADRVPNAGGLLTVYGDVTAAELLTYFLDAFGKPSRLNALGFLKTWADAKLNDNFTLEQF